MQIGGGVASITPRGREPVADRPAVLDQRSGCPTGKPAKTRGRARGAALSVAHVIHVLPDPADPGLLDQLLGNAEKNAAVALHGCHQALELDGQAHDYSADEWLPAIYDIAAPLLEAARLNREPPSLVGQAQEAVSWLSRAIVDLDQDAPDVAAAIVDVLGRILALHVFADVARNATAEHGE